MKVGSVKVAGFFLFFVTVGMTYIPLVYYGRIIFILAFYMTVELFLNYTYEIWDKIELEKNLQI